MSPRFLIPAIAVAALSFTTPALAQPRGWIDSSSASYAAEQRQSFPDTRRAAYDNGHREGLKLGVRDGRRGDAFRYQDDRTYQRADKGYHRSFGDVDRYRQAFRNGFAAGYGEGYQRYGRDRGRGPRYGGGYGGGSGGGNPAAYPGGRYGAHPGFQNGLNDGYEKGIEDAGKRRSFDVLRHKWYREGDRHYSSRYGARAQYKDIYREGFKTGYERGYREGRWR